jgi:hypothetical protein
MYRLELQLIVSTFGGIGWRYGACVEAETYIVLSQEMEGTEHLIIVKLEALRRFKSL